MAIIIVEDGTGVSGANSYNSEAELTTYATDRGLTLTGTPAVLLIQSMDYIESQSYKAQKTNSTQALQFPRTGLVLDGYTVSSTTIPNELKNGQLATAIAIDEGNDPLSALEPGVKKEKVGDIEIEYQDGAASETIARTINASLKKLLSGGSGGSSFTVSRG